MALLTNIQLKKMEFKHLGENVRISDKASIYRPEMISIGNNVRIDDFVVISAGDGGVKIGNNIHIAVFCSIIGKGKVAIKDFANFSSRVSVYSSNDDYSGESMTNPTIESKFTNVDHRSVAIGKHVIIGCGAVILPGATLETGVVIGALSFVKAGKYNKFSMYAGIPAKYIKKRSDRLLKVEKEYLKVR